MRKWIVLASAALPVLFLVGCGNAMSGTWKLEYSEQVKKMAEAAKGMGSKDAQELPTAEMVFDSGGSYTVNMQMGSQSMAAKGTYKLDGRDLTLTTTEQNGKPLTGTDLQPVTVKLSEDGKSFLFPQFEQLGKFVKQ